MKEKRNGLLISDLQNRSFIINNEVIKLPPSEFIIYLHYLTNKTGECKYKSKSSCNDCDACFASFYHTITNGSKLIDLYKQVYSEYSDNYQKLKTKSKKKQFESYSGFLQKISKINRKIKSQLTNNANTFCISRSGNYGCTVYGIKLDRNKIIILNQEKL